MPLLALLLAAASPPLPSQLNDPTTTEGWIWQQVQANRPADLNQRCDTPPLDVHDVDDARWRSDCRRVRPAVLQALLTQPDLADAGPPSVVIRNAYIDGALDFEGARIRASQVAFQGCRLAGDLMVADARFDGVLDLSGSSIAGRFIGSYGFVAGRLMLIDAIVSGGIEAPSMHIGSSLFLRGTQIGGAVVLRDARIDNQMDMSGAAIATGKPFDAERLSVGRGGVQMRKVTFGGPVDLGLAEIDGQVVIEEAVVAAGQPFRGSGLHVHHGGLFLQDVTFGGPVYLREADVDKSVELQRSSIAPGQGFDAQRLHAGAGGLIASDVAFGGGTDLHEARVDGQLDLSRTRFAPDARLMAQLLRVGGALLARDVTFGRIVELQGLRVGSILDLRGARLHELRLEGADIKADLVLGGRLSDAETLAHWDACGGGASCLNLRNAKVANLQDDERAWPARITLEGFTYTHLGGAGGEQRQDMRNRPIAWWRDWLLRDPVYSAQPYAQLAAVLAAAGNRDGAAEIRFFSRDRQRSELLRGCRWLQALGLVDKPGDERPCEPAQVGSWCGLSALQVFVGYGIGGYGFRAVGWALVFSLIGMVTLCFAPGVRGIRPSPLATRRGPRQKSLLWCFGASLNRVLPLVTISQEFSEFFNDPKRERLQAWQHVAFGLLALCGWALGVFVVAAFSGLIQN